MLEYYHDMDKLLIYLTEKRKIAQLNGRVLFILAIVQVTQTSNDCMFVDTSPGCCVDCKCCNTAHTKRAFHLAHYLGC